MRNLHINWQDGMKVNKTHFQGMENALLNDLTDYASLKITSYGYGLLPEKSGGSSCDLYFKLDQSGQAVLNLLTCRAITPGGAFILIDAQHQHQQEYRISREMITALPENGKDLALYVLINIDIFSRVPYGENLPGENPPRQPFTIPKTYLSVSYYPEISHQNINGTSQLIVGRLVSGHNGLEKDESYIPPCVSVDAFNALDRYFSSWEVKLKDDLMEGIRLTAEQIKKKGNLKSADRQMDDFGERISVAAAILKLASALQTKLFGLIPQLPLLREAPFLFTVSALQQLAGVFLAGLSSLSNENVNILDNYLKEALKIENLKPTFNEFFEFKYNHDRIDEAVKACDKFILLLSRLFDRNSGLPVKDFEWKTIEVDTIEIKDLGRQSTI